MKAVLERTVKTADVVNERPFADSVMDPGIYFDQWLVALDEYRNRKPLEDSAGVLLNGEDLDFENVLAFDDQLAEKLEAPGTLVVTERGILKGDVEVSVALIDGVFKGNITATESVVIENHAVVIGDINTPELTIRGGAIIEGKCTFPGPKEKEKENPPVWSALRVSLSKVWRGRVSEYRTSKS